MEVTEFMKDRMEDRDDHLRGGKRGKAQRSILNVCLIISRVSLFGSGKS